jgi:site-specific recombinase XerD
MMMTQTFVDPGPLTHQGTFLAFVQVFVEQMQAKGYAAASMKTSTRLVKEFAVWLDLQGIASQSLSAKHVVNYLDHRWLQRRRRRGDAFTLEAFARHVAPDEYECRPEQAIAISPALRVRHEFEWYLLHERGLAAASILLYGDSIGRFLDSVFGNAEVRLDQLTAPDIIGFVQTEAARLRHPKRAQVMTTALRSFLQYGRYRGEIVVDLQSCVPTVANWSMTGIPKTISPAQVQSLLGHCDRQSATGRRDYAMLLLISRLGLRASEVVNLTLDDLDWTEGAIHIRGPAQRVDRLPLPADVGAALVDYLRQARPDCASRNVFLRSRAPRRALLGPGSVSCIVFRALRRAGIESPTKGAHLLRHSLATQMLGGGASLGEIAEILRHRNPQTTTIYAKVDLVSLHTLALAWPGGVQ